MTNILKLHQDLADGTYQHSKYHPFKLSDPKPRNIHKANVRDRLLHKAIYRILYPTFDRTFISDSYSCRNDKGTHKAFTRLESVTKKVSKNYTKPCFALKCDIRRFFDSVDHKILINLLESKIANEELLNLLKNIIQSFEHSSSKGMPLGNLTSQLFANIYMDPLDKFAKHKLRAKYYLRYADDFVFLSDGKDGLMGYLVEVNQFLKINLKLNLHPNKLHLRKLNWGIDYVGYVALPHYNLPRKKTVKRIFTNLERAINLQVPNLESQYQSCRGYLDYASSYRLQTQLQEMMDYATKL